MVAWYDYNLLALEQAASDAGRKGCFGGAWQATENERLAAVTARNPPIQLLAHGLYVVTLKGAFEVSEQLIILVILSSKNKQTRKPETVGIASSSARGRLSGQTCCGSWRGDIHSTAQPLEVRAANHAHEAETHCGLGPTGLAPRVH